MDGLATTVRFLRMAASQLRHLAERVPEIADELLPMARQLDTEAADLTADLTADPGPPAAA